MKPLKALLGFCALPFMLIGAAALCFVMAVYEVSADVGDCAVDGIKKLMGKQ